MSLFREQVSEHRKVRLHGQVVLTQPLSGKLIAGGLLVVVAFFALWIFLGSYARIETAPGILITDQPSAKVIVPVPGLVTELLVEDGTLVRKGDRIAIIDLDRRGTTGGAVVSEGIDAINVQRAINQDQIALSEQQRRAETARLNNVILAARNQTASLQSQILLQKDAIVSNQRLFDGMKPVMDRGFISKVEFERRRQMLIASQQTLASLEQEFLAKNAEAEAARAQLASVSLQTERAVSEIKVSMERLSQQRAQLEGEKAYVVTAPITGRVTALQTAQGRAASANVPLMIIVPDGSNLRAEVYAPSRAIGFVQPGQETRLLFDAFPYQRFGSFEGRVKAVSRTVIDPRESDIPLKLEEPVYRVTVTLNRQMVEAYGDRVALQPGMTLEANIVLERQNFLDWLLKPLNAVLKRTA